MPLKNHDNKLLPGYMDSDALNSLPRVGGTPTYLGKTEGDENIEFTERKTYCVKHFQPFIKCINVQDNTMKY